MAALFRSTRRIAVVGASANSSRPSNGVLRYLAVAGYEVVPINPGETEIAGFRCYPTLAAAVAESGQVNIVDVFRRAELCVPHAEEAVAVGAR
jgi:predicted CoA-binding protein